MRDCGTYFGYMPMSGIAGSWGRTIGSFLRNCQVDFQRAIQIGAPTSNEEVLSVCTSLAVCVVIWVFNLS